MLGIGGTRDHGGKSSNDPKLVRITCLRHPDCDPAVHNRTSVFQQMREALSAMERVVTEGSWLEDDDSLMSPVCLHSVVKQFEDAVERTRVTLVQPTDKEKLQDSLEVIIDQANDFTDSAYTSHEHREKILALCENARMELQALLQVDTNNPFSRRRRLHMHPAFLPPGLWNRKASFSHIWDQGGKLDTTEELETAIIKTCKSMKELKKQLQNTALDQASEIFKTNEDHDILSTLKLSGTQGDADRMEEYCGKFAEHSEQLIEACRLLRHIAGNDPLYITACHADSCIRNLSPQLVTAAQTLVANPASKIARENLDVFCDAWESQINEMSVLVKEINDFCSGRKGEKTVYLSLPRPGQRVKGCLKSISEDKCGVIYHISCQGNTNRGPCRETYIGETKRSLKTRFLEHRRPSSVASEVSQHIHIESPGHTVDLEGVRILDTEQDYFKRGIKEAIYIRALQPSLNRDGGAISTSDNI
ncbi:Alpha-catulin [Branchiostoma belcheri]|nr:Alpha-catulin [Branchiostoma belcheri]